MGYKLDQKKFNYVKNGLIYKPLKIGISSSNLANFATSRGCNLAETLLSQVFITAFFLLA